MAIIRNILVRVGADINPLQNGMREARTNLQRFNQSVGSTMGVFNSRMSAQMQSLSLTMAKAQANTALANSQVKGFGSASQIAATKLTGLKAELQVQQKMVAQLEQEFHKAVMATNSDVTATRKLEIELIRAKQLERDLKNEISLGSKSLKQYDLNSKLATNGLFKFSGFLRTAALAAAVAFAAISGKAIKAAMETVESENLFTVSMGNMAGAARQWSDQLQESLGLNAYQVRQNVGLFYNMTTSMGVARDKAYQVSTGLTELAYNMASFYNTDYDTMFTKLQSGISGEMEPLRRLGVIVSETVTQQYAYTHGIAKQGATLTEAQKVMARYGTIMEQTKNAQGDLARTIMSPANQWRIFQTQIQLSSINLGNAFMPIVERVLPVLTSLAKGLVTVTSTFAQFMRALFGGNSAQAQTAQSAADAAAAQTQLGNATAAAGAKAKKGIASFDEINQLQKSMAANAADATATTPSPQKDDISGGIAQGLVDIAQKIRDALAPASEAIDKLKTSINDFAIKVAPDLKTISEVLKPLFSTSVQVAADAINSFTKAISSVFSGDLKSLEGILSTVAGILKGDWKQAWQGGKTVVDGLKDALTGAWNILQWMYNPIGKVTTLVLDHVGAQGKLKAAWSWIKDNAAAVFKPDNIVNAWNQVKSVHDATWAPITKGLTGFWNFINTNTGPYFQGVKNTISTSWDGIKKKSDEIWGPVWDKLKTVWYWVRDNASIFDVAKNNITRAFNNIGSTVSRVWEGIKTDIKNSINSIIGNINSFIRRINNIKITVPKVNIPLVGDVGGFSIGLPQIPEIPVLDKGGIVTKPTLTMLSKNSKPEGIVPLEDTSFVDSIASAIGSAVSSAMQFSQPQNSGHSAPQTLILKVGETEFGRVAISSINAVQRQGGITLLMV